MRFLATLLTFAGYALVYASVANHGRFAKDPWYGLFTDAYNSHVVGDKSSTNTSPTP